MRHVQKIYHNHQSHWVGDGFEVTPLFSHMGEARQTSPFLMLDYAVPREFAPNFGVHRGVGEHPHRGFETVTIAYQGEVAHRDGSGATGVIEQGDVQWMTAGRGTVHEEFHSPAFSQRGGWFEMAQIWVNLPREHKLVAPRYQHLKNADIPVVAINGGSLRLIAGEYHGTQGAGLSHSELNIWDVTVYQKSEIRLTLPENHNVSLAIRRGQVQVNHAAHWIAKPTDLIVFERMQGEFVLQNMGDDVAELLLLSGVPIDEPIVAYGPFVMNTKAEIIESIEMFRRGELGSLR